MLSCAEAAAAAWNLGLVSATSSHEERVAAGMTHWMIELMKADHPQGWTQPHLEKIMIIMKNHAVWLDWNQILTHIFREGHPVELGVHMMSLMRIQESENEWGASPLILALKLVDDDSPGWGNLLDAIETKWTKKGLSNKHAAVMILDCHQAPLGVSGGPLAFALYSGKVRVATMMLDRVEKSPKMAKLYLPDGVAMEPHIRSLSPMAIFLVINPLPMDLGQQLQFGGRVAKLDIVRQLHFMSSEAIFTNFLDALAKFRRMPAPLVTILHFRFIMSLFPPNIQERVREAVNDHIFVLHERILQVGGADRYQLLSRMIHLDLQLFGWRSGAGLQLVAPVDTAVGGLPWSFCFADMRPPSMRHRHLHLNKHHHAFQLERLSWVTIVRPLIWFVRGLRLWAQVTRIMPDGIQDPMAHLVLPWILQPPSEMGALGPARDVDKLWRFCVDPKVDILKRLPGEATGERGWAVRRTILKSTYLGLAEWLVLGRKMSQVDHPTLFY